MEIFKSEALEKEISELDCSRFCCQNWTKFSVMCSFCREAKCNFIKDYLLDRLAGFCSCTVSKEVKEKTDLIIKSYQKSEDMSNTKWSEGNAIFLGIDIFFVWFIQ